MVSSGAMEHRSDGFHHVANTAAAMMTVMASSTTVEVDAQAASVRMALRFAMLARTVADLPSAPAAAPNPSMKPPTIFPHVSDERSWHALPWLRHFDDLPSWSSHAWI